MRTFTKPVMVRAGHDSPKAADFNNHARAIEELQRRLNGADLKGPKKRPTNHPFKLILRTEGENKLLSVQFGNVFVPLVATDTALDVIPSMQAVEPTMSDGTSGLLNNPFDTEEGTETLSSGTEYGVWLEVTAGNFEQDLDGQTGNNGMGDVTYGDMTISPYGAGAVSTAKIYTSTDYTEKTDLSSLVTSQTGKAYVYLGKIKDDETIEQVHRSDVVVPPWMLNSGLLALLAHPWRVTDGGSGTFDVAAGKVLSWENEQAGLGNIPSWTHLKAVSEYAGGTVTGTGASGYIYGEIAYTPGDTWFEADMADGLIIDRVVPTGTINVDYAAALPELSNTSFIFEIAEITVAGATTTISQTLTHNPAIQNIDIPAELEGGSTVRDAGTQ